MKAPPRSRFAPERATEAAVAKTCSRCHSDAAYMKQYGIPTDQFAKYITSVHHDALAVRGDLSNLIEALAIEFGRPGKR